jgi:hypothetical protein
MASSFMGITTSDTSNKKKRGGGPTKVAASQLKDGEEGSDGA